MKRSLLVIASFLLAILSTVLLVGAVQASEGIETDPPTGFLNVEITDESAYEVIINGGYFNSYQDCGTYLFIPGIAGECLSGTSGAFERQHFFPGPGIYTVTLTINGAGGFLTLQDQVIFNPNPKCGMGHLVPDPFNNYVTFAANWEDGSPTGEYEFDFGDGSPTLVFTGTTGSMNFDHDYPIVPGETKTYYLGYDVYNDINPNIAHCRDSVIIDYREPVVYKTFLPFLTKFAPEASCSVTISEQEINHVVFNVNWENAGNGSHTFAFGDGAETLQFSGSSGSGSTWHDYPWPEEKFIATMNLSGGGSCSAQVDINWP